jgi:hypothetical protein
VAAGHARSRHWRDTPDAALVAAESRCNSCGKFAAALDNAIEKYYLRFHDRSDAG